MVAPRNTPIDGTPCPQCKRTRDEHGSCWKCFTRPCVLCGLDTGSCLISSCIACQRFLPDAPEPAPCPTPTPCSGSGSCGTGPAPTSGGGSTAPAGPDPLPWC
ncbi:hypothetical protein GobsT_64170 [Gemmata obscuriglobus]|nr:hypothetical protein GobsT_64170 [Gemmata obscuriglobus]VTS10937.1 unnamed protein product [Gemmata obscuriglobus UQM 2246]